ncbi:MAG TPA: hypothetical protein VN673_10060, partial [Clostridia bacterium]|nr:hypothetical protein [Clostridia bacterium]
ARTELLALRARVEHLQQDLALQQRTAPAAVDLGFIKACSSTNLSAAQTEQLLAELGFNWNTTGDYLVVSKTTLSTTTLGGMEGARISDAACQVLAITPAERNTIEATTQQLAAEYDAWAQAQIQREEPTGDIVAKYSIPTDPAFSLSLSNRFVDTLRSTLGEERSSLLKKYSYSWMNDIGVFRDDPVTLTVKRYMAGNVPRFNMELRQNRGGMSCDVSPWQPLPIPFRPIFPGGWADLARREGFDLPADLFPN